MVNRCAHCGAALFKDSQRDTLFQRKQEAGVIAAVKWSNRSARSDLGALKQSLKGHKRYKNKVNPSTGVPYTSILERFDCEPLYRFRMMSMGWTRDMIPKLQDLIEKPILGDKPSLRSKEKIRGSGHYYVANPELDVTGELRNSAAYDSNPDWKRTREQRHKFNQELQKFGENKPVQSWVAGVLEEGFGVEAEVDSDVEMETPGEDHPSASWSDSASASAAAADWSWKDWQSSQGRYVDEARWQDASASGSWQPGRYVRDSGWNRNASSATWTRSAHWIERQAANPRPDAQPHEQRGWYR
jgi:hypothetical protein